MGLDQHAHLRNAKIDWAKYYSEEEYSGEPQVFVWRKHARLQQFMAVKYAEQNPKDKDNDMNLGFNGGPVKLTKEVVDQLEEAVKNNYLLFIIINSTIIENKIVRTNRDQKQSIHYLYKKYHT